MDDLFPVEVRAPLGARMMEIEWNDGTTSILPHRLLRGFCPCAGCQGHHGPVRWLSPPQGESTLDIREIEETGTYALRFVWGDGHETGIYRFVFLRELSKLWQGDESTWLTLSFGRL